MRKITQHLSVLLVGIAMVCILLNPVWVYAQAAVGGSGAYNSTFIPSGLFYNSDTTPDAQGELLYDTTVTGIANGAFVWYDGSSARYFIDLGTLPSDDDYVVAYDADADAFYMKADATGGSSTFVGLTDTPGSFSTANVVYTSNGTPDAVIESGVQLTGGTNTFALTNGTASLDVAAGATANFDTSLTVDTEAVTLNQSVSTTDDVTFADLALTGFLSTTPSGDQTIAAGTSITVANNIIRVVGDSGPVVSTATPFLASPAVDGVCVKLQGTNETNTVTIQDDSVIAGSELQLSHNQSFILGKGDMIELCYDLDDDDWYENGRSDN
jgi:hypothetical protein